MNMHITKVSTEAPYGCKKNFEQWEMLELTLANIFMLILVRNFKTFDSRSDR